MEQTKARTLTVSYTHLDSGGEIKDYTSDPVIVAAAETENPKPESILANCSAELVKDGKFQQDDTGVDVRVKLDSHVESCYLTIYAYAGNTSFDPDDSHNKRLWSGRVTDGYEAVSYTHLISMSSDFQGFPFCCCWLWFFWDFFQIKRPLRSGS